MSVSIRVRVNPDNIAQYVVDTQDNSTTPFAVVGTGARMSLAATAAWQEFILAVPDATRAFKVGDVVDTDMSGVTHAYDIRLGSTWFRIGTGATIGADSVISGAPYTFMGNISTLKPS